MTLIARLGTLRVILLMSALICSPMVWLADSEPEGIGVITAYVVPSLVIMLFFVLLLDAMMNRIFMLEQTGQHKADRRLRMWSALVTVAIMVTFWVPYFRTIGDL